MNTKNKIIASAAIITACSVVFFAFKDKEHDQETHKLQKLIYLYQLSPSVAVSANRFPELVRKFSGNGFTALKQSQVAGGMRYISADPSEFYEINESQGRFSFSRNLSRYMGNYKPVLPEGRAAQAIATKFLNENKLMAENPSEMQLIHSGGLRADDGNGNVLDKLVTLTYGRVIDGTPVIGKGSKIVVNIGDKGEVEGVIRNWKAFTSRKELNVREIKKEEEMKSELMAQVATQFGKGAIAEIRRSYMVYFDNAGRFLQPVMAYETTVSLKGTNGQPKELPYLGIIESMRTPAEKLNLTGIDPAGIRTINANKVSPDRRAQPLDKGD